MTMPARHSTAGTLRLVSKSEVPLPSIVRAKLAPPYLVAGEQERRQLLRNMQFALAMRQHAVHRVRRKATTAQLAAYGLVTVLGGLAICGIGWPGIAFTSGTARAAITTLMLSCTAFLATIRATRSNHHEAIGKLAVCIVEIDQTKTDLLADRAIGAATFAEVRQRYLDALQQCDAPHRHVDYLAAHLGGAKSHGQWKWRLAYFSDVYLMPALLICVPIVSSL